MEMRGKVAVVTGSSAGVGRATAERLAALGAKVVVNYAHSEADAEATVAAIRQAGGTAHACRADVRSDADCRALIQSAVDAYGGLHVLVNNAGMTRFIPHAELDLVTDEVWDEILSANVRGTFNCTRAAAPHMRAAGEGAVVNVASVAGLGGGGSSIPYAASKSAIITMTKSLARVLGPEIRVNCIAPGFIDGRWLRGGLGERYAQARDAAAQRAPLRAVATPDSCADAILALIQYSTHITGQTVVVDGGASL
ncbi:MAG: SDR family oxidoreductase [Chloroflexi bacterium]|nr:SDR family oxidoreductase [Chloroflexota bacterium]